MYLWLLSFAALAALAASVFALVCARVNPVSQPGLYVKRKWRTVAAGVIGTGLLITVTQLYNASALPAAVIFVAGVLGVAGAAMHGRSRRSDAVTG